MHVNAMIIMLKKHQKNVCYKTHFFSLDKSIYLMSHVILYFINKLPDETPVIYLPFISGFRIVKRLPKEC